MARLSAPVILSRDLTLRAFIRGSPGLTPNGTIGDVEAAVVACESSQSAFPFARSSG